MTLGRRGLIEKQSPFNFFQLISLELQFDSYSHQRKYDHLVPNSVRGLDKSRYSCRLCYCICVSIHHFALSTRSGLQKMRQDISTQIMIIRVMETYHLLTFHYSLDSEDDFRSGCRNVSQSHPK